MAVLKVSSQAQLELAVKNVRSGDTIALSSGTYDGFTASKFAFSQKVTITSADAGNPAVLNEFLLRGASNVEFKNLRFDYNPSKSGDTPFWIEGSRNINFVDIDIEGQIVGRYGAGIGLRIKNSNTVTLQNSEISDFRNGLYASNSTNVDIINNDFRGMSNDGMLLGGMTDVLIAGNDFRDMNSPPDRQHKDSIQFMTTSGESGSRDVVIRDNVIENREISHGIFLTNSQFNSGNGSAYHRNILIEDNVVRSNHVHGISVNHGDGVTIRGNVVEQIQGGSNIPLINVSRSSKNVLIQGNDVESVPQPQNSSWTVIGNDTGGKGRMHWYGSSTGSSSSKFAAASGSFDEAEESPSDGLGVRDGGSETFRIAGHMLKDGTTRFRIEDVDFSDGDVIVFNNFDRGTFQDERGGNTVSIWNDGAGARIDSALDLQEIVHASPDVSAITKGDELILKVRHDDGLAEVVFAGLGGAFRAADHPELF